MSNLTEYRRIRKKVATFGRRSLTDEERQIFDGNHWTARHKNADSTNTSKEGGTNNGEKR